MRRTILDSPTGYPQFAGVPLVTAGPQPTCGRLRRAEKAAPCGCLWAGLCSGGGYSDGAVLLCDTHALPED